MSQQIEIEFKNLLTRAQYETLLTTFDVAPHQIIRQMNHYFDTPDEHLKHLASGLRIRQFPENIECTLKEKSGEHAHLETTDPLSETEASAMLADGVVRAPHVVARLQQLNVPLEQLSLIGTLTTDRVELDYKGGLLVLDHSFYLHCDDYEVEYETNDETFGKNTFNELLQQFDIIQQPTPKKLARFMQALKQQKG
ncbi:MAG: CYTH domain-containing protein [Solibacillus sp.]